MGNIVLVTGGVRCGKSGWAIKHGESISAMRHLFIATAEAVDDEMKQRRINHRIERGDRWDTIEESCHINNVISEFTDKTVAVIDCCTVWLGNIWHHFGNDDITLEKHIDDFIQALQTWKKDRDGTIIIVSNEVGWGIVPNDASVRRYRDWAGRLNQQIGAISDDVYLTVAGITIPIKRRIGND